MQIQIGRAPRAWLSSFSHCLIATGLKDSSTIIISREAGMQRRKLNLFYVAGYLLFCIVLLSSVLLYSAQYSPILGVNMGDVHGSWLILVLVGLAVLLKNEFYK
jgi:hypothetical protein